MGNPCPALPGAVFALPQSLAVPQGHVLWCHPELSQDTLQDLQVLGDIPCSLSLSSQPVPAATAASPSQKRAKKQSAKYFQGTPASGSFSPACRTCMSDTTQCSLPSSSQSPRHTTPPDIHIKGVVLGASHPISKI